MHPVRKFLLMGFCLSGGLPAFCQQADSTRPPQMMPPVSVAGETPETVYHHPRFFHYIAGVPSDIAHMSAVPFQKKALVPVSFIAGSTGLLLLFDQRITNLTGRTLHHWGITQQEQMRDVVELGKYDLFNYPANVNTFFYGLGKTAPTLMLVGGFFAAGKIGHNDRALRTAYELTESYMNSLVTVQTLKRITGRQSPNRATIPGGKWHWFPSLSKYQRDITNYIAFPSGHMADLMSAVTVIAENYPEKKWIRPIGYSMIGLMGISMLNNKVHWASDFPLGLGIGYISGKITHRRHQKEFEKSHATPILF